MELTIHKNSDIIYGVFLYKDEEYLAILMATHSVICDYNEVRIATLDIDRSKDGCGIINDIGPIIYSNDVKELTPEALAKEVENFVGEPVIIKYQEGIKA